MYTCYVVCYVVCQRKKGRENISAKYKYGTEEVKLQRGGLQQVRLNMTLSKDLGGARQFEVGHPVPTLNKNLFFTAISVRPFLMGKLHSTSSATSSVCVLPQ